MRFTNKLVLTSALMLATPVWADGYGEAPKATSATRDRPSSNASTRSGLTDRNRARDAISLLTSARKAVEKAENSKSNAAKLNSLDMAIAKLKQARVPLKNCTSEACDYLRSTVDAALVDALDDEAEIYFDRRSFRVAEKKVVSALKIDPYDPRTNDLFAAIRAAKVYGGSYFGRGAYTQGGPMTQ